MVTSGKLSLAIIETKLWLIWTSKSVYTSHNPQDMYSISCTAMAKMTCAQEERWTKPQWIAHIMQKLNLQSVLSMDISGLGVNSVPVNLLTFEGGLSLNMGETFSFSYEILFVIW